MKSFRYTTASLDEVFFMITMIGYSEQIEFWGKKATGYRQVVLDRRQRVIWRIKKISLFWSIFEHEVRSPISVQHHAWHTIDNFR